VKSAVLLTRKLCSFARTATTNSVGPGSGKFPFTAVSREPASKESGALGLNAPSSVFCYLVFEPTRSLPMIHSGVRCCLTTFMTRSQNPSWN
jgi:hypothetical protein